MRSALKLFAELFIKKRLAEGIDKSKFENFRPFQMEIFAFAPLVAAPLDKIVILVYNEI